MYVVKEYNENGGFMNAFYYHDREMALEFARGINKIKPLAYIHVMRIQFDEDGEIYLTSIN